MPFYHYNQNKSGGHFDLDEAAGITHHVVIEAPSAFMADAKLVSIGGYFDGCSIGLDCPCCGDRWSTAWEDGGDKAPEIYGTPIAEFDGTEWLPKGKNIAVHYLDGRVEWS